MGGLERLVSRLQVVDSHQVFVLLKNAEESYEGRWPGLAAPTDICNQKAWDMPCALAVRDKMLAEADQEPDSSLKKKIRST